MNRQPTQVNGITRWAGVEDNSAKKAEAVRRPVVLRQEIGEVLSQIRQQQGRTLREVSHLARVSLGYLSEVERGQKEASSELLASIAAALEVPLAVVLREVTQRIALMEGLIDGSSVPDTIPAEFYEHGGVSVPDSLPEDFGTVASA